MACPTPYTVPEDCTVTVVEFTGAAANTLNLGTFATIAVGALVVFSLAILALAAIRR